LAGFNQKAESLIRCSLFVVRYSGIGDRGLGIGFRVARVGGRVWAWPLPLGEATQPKWAESRNFCALQWLTGKEQSAMPVKSFRELDAWRVAMDLALTVYNLAEKLPAKERYEMASQMRRAALSVPSNIAEGSGSRMRGRYRYHVRISLGSVSELITCVELGQRLGYWDARGVAGINDQLTRTAQLLNGVLRSIGREKLAKAATAVPAVLLTVVCLLKL
jgi:four helix bundle protein